MPKRILLFCLLLAVGSRVSQAQTTLASETFKQRLRGKYLHNDTAQAIINLYSTRQAGGAGWVSAGILSAVRIGIDNTGTNNSSAYSTPAQSPGFGVAFLAASPILAYGVGKIIHYGNANLEHILTDYAAGKPLAQSLRRKLRPRFFSQPIMKYQRVPVQAVPAQKALAPSVNAQPAQKKSAQVESTIQAAPQLAPMLDNAMPNADVQALPVQQAPAQAVPQQLDK